MSRSKRTRSAKPARLSSFDRTTLALLAIPSFADSIRASHVPDTRINSASYQALNRRCLEEIQPVDGVERKLVLHLIHFIWAFQYIGWIRRQCARTIVTAPTVAPDRTALASLQDLELLQARHADHITRIARHLSEMLRRRGVAVPSFLNRVAAARSIHTIVNVADFSAFCESSQDQTGGSDSRTGSSKTHLGTRRELL